MQDTEDYVAEPVNIVICWFWPELDFYFEQNLQSWEIMDLIFYCTVCWQSIFKSVKLQDNERI